MRTLEDVLEEVARQRGPLTRRGTGYGEVWAALNRYATAVLQQRRTLAVANFCKIGWRVEELAQGRAKLRPHFQVTEAFARANNMDLRSQVTIPDKHFTTIEEFNFSKAAIRYSQSLTKDNVFMGLRAILQHLGAIVSSGQPMSIDLEVGKLVCSERELRFFFVADLYIEEGLEVPAGALESSAYKPSATFMPPSKDALTLSLTGTRHLGDHHGSVKATALGGWEDGAPSAASRDGVDGEDGEAGEGGEDREADSECMESDMTFCPPTGRSDLSVQDRVQQEALNRHLAQLSLEAASAMAEREQWESHLKRCAAEEQSDRDWRKALNKEHSLHLQAQMQQAEDRRADARQHCIQQASLHDFPSFAESQDLAVYDYIRERRTTLKQDLDQQVDAKKFKKMAERQREREMEASHAEAGEREMRFMKQEASAKREGERAALTQAWEQDGRLRAARKAVQNHHKAPAKNSGELPGLVRSVLAGAPPAPAAPAAPSPLALPSPRSDSGPPSSRLLTGSVRRMPLGAAASLALHRERLGSALRR